MKSIMTIELTQIAASGEAFGRDEDGRAVFVPDAVPGETVEVETAAEAKRWRRGVPVSYTHLTLPTKRIV